MWTYLRLGFKENLDISNNSIPNSLVSLTFKACLYQVGLWWFLEKVRFSVNSQMQPTSFRTASPGIMRDNLKCITNLNYLSVIFKIHCYLAWILFLTAFSFCTESSVLSLLCNEWYSILLWSIVTSFSALCMVPPTPHPPTQILAFFTFFTPKTLFKNYQYFGSSFNLFKTTNLWIIIKDPLRPFTPHLESLVPLFKSPRWKPWLH